MRGPFVWVLVLERNFALLAVGSGSAAFTIRVQGMGVRACRLVTGCVGACVGGSPNHLGLLPKEFRLEEAGCMARSQACGFQGESSQSKGPFVRPSRILQHD